jgi:hypothetical protein
LEVLCIPRVSVIHRIISAISIAIIIASLLINLPPLLILQLL